MRCVRLAGAVLLLTALAARAADADNLIVNGACEQARPADAKAPAGWSKPDGITSFWDRATGKPGGCLKFDTSVLKVDKQQFVAAEAAAQAAPAKKGQGGKYDTVGAHEGAWLWSNAIEIKPDDSFFILEADVRAPALSTPLFYPQVFVRGYQKFDAKRDAGTNAYWVRPHADGPECTEQFGKDEERRDAHEGDLIMVYRHALVCRLTKVDEYQHFRLAIKLPTEARFRPNVIMLKPYACWPLGAYYFDNLVFRRATKAEYDAVKAVGHSVPGTGG